MDDATSQSWYQLCAAAVVELDPKRLIERVDAADAAIHGRLRDLQYDSDHHDERQLMENAQRTLAFLRRCPEAIAARDANQAAKWALDIKPEQPSPPPGDPPVKAESESVQF